MYMKPQPVNQLMPTHM